MFEVYENEYLELQYFNEIAICDLVNAELDLAAQFDKEGEDYVIRMY